MSFDGGIASTGPDPGNSLWWSENPPTSHWPAQGTSATDLLPSDWLSRLWSDATATAREASWDFLPDRIGDAAEGKRVTRGDIAFLSSQSASRSGSLASATAALRTLGRLVEDQPQLLDDALPALENALREEVAGLRSAAAEAIWQARAFKALPALAVALGEERDDTVRATLEHVLRILR